MGRNKGSKNKEPAKDKRPPRSRGWVLTFNNWDEETVKSLKAVAKDGHTRYVLYGEEKAPTTGTPHLQTFILFKDLISEDAMRLKFPKVHVEPQKADHITNMIYCMKDDKYTEIGDRPHQGKRSDLDVIYKDIKNGRPMVEIAREYPTLYSLYRRAFDAYAKLEHDQSGKAQTILYYYLTEHEFKVMSKVIGTGVQYMDEISAKYYEGKVMLSSSVMLTRSTLMYHLCKGTFKEIYVSDNTLPNYMLEQVEENFSNVEVYRWSRVKGEFVKSVPIEGSEDL